MDDSNKPDQKCIDHAMWQKQFMIAHYLLLGSGAFIGVFTDRPVAGLVMITAAIGVYLYASHKEVQHIKWHAEQERSKHGM